MRRHPLSKALISPSRHLTAHERLELYAQQYWWRIQAAFDEDFSTVRQVLSAETYEKLRDSYLTLCPSHSYTLRDLGSRFPAYLAKRSTSLKIRLALVKDCALFDWARIEAFDGAEHPPLIATDIERAGFARRKLFLQPHVRLLDLKHPVDTLIRPGAERSQEEMSNTLRQKKLAAKGTSGSSVARKRTFLAVHRRNDRVFMKRLSPLEFEILSKFKEGISLYHLLTGSQTRWPSGALAQFCTDVSSLGWLYIGLTVKEKV